MWKRLLRILEYKRQKAEDKRQIFIRLKAEGLRLKLFLIFYLKHSVFSLQPIFCLLFSAFYILSSVSCTPKHVETPSYEGIPVEHALSELKNIKSIEAILSVEYERNNNADVNTMSGEALLNVSEDKLNLRLYYLGFLAGEVNEEGGIIKSKPKLDKNKSTILIDGIKNSFFWWNIKDYTLQEKGDLYELKNPFRKLLISKKTLLPIQQTIELNDGEELKIFYDAPNKTDSNESAATNNKKSDSNQLSIVSSQNNSPSATHHSSLSLWYNSRMKIEFKNYIVKIKVKSYSVVR
ncbi:hypothetical protein A45J_1870 [hot springs metagenome]|uniref:Uncharacterized protein n=1 Tax=hot springs metagenome TaxID=433727 RepID=A0A5J4L4G5_9ZZZZ